MNSLDIFTVWFSAMALAALFIYHKFFSLKRLRWKEDLYKLCAVRDRFLRLQIEGKIKDTQVYSTFYNFINFGIAGAQEPDVAWFARTLVEGRRDASEIQYRLRAELASNPELARVLYDYVEVLFVDIIEARSVLFRSLVMVYRCAKRLGIPRLVDWIRIRREKTRLFRQQRDVYSAYSWFRDLQAV